jgi:hypothetical protein
MGGSILQVWTVGMAFACSATEGGCSGCGVQSDLLAKETAVGYWPQYQARSKPSLQYRLSYRGYSCPNGFAQTCVQIATKTAFQAVTCESGTSGHFTYLTIPATISTVAIPSYTLDAPLIQVNWHALDRATSSTSPSNTAAPSSGLLPGAKAGFGVDFSF